MIVFTGVFFMFFPPDLMLLFIAQTTFVRAARVYQLREWFLCRRERGITTRLAWLAPVCSRILLVSGLEKDRG